MQGRFVKTSAGQTEIQARTHALPRSVRNLLLVINDTQPVDFWLGSVRGISEADVDLLLAEGLIEPVGMHTLHAGQVMAAPAADSDWAQLKQRINATGYVPLYDALTAQGKSHLGLMKGYRFVLEVEKCNGLEALRELAHRFTEQLRDEAGMAAVRRFTEALIKA
jgi:hypothetical protein